MASVHLAVAGMHCGHCKAKVARALEEVGGVYGVTVDLEGGGVDVELDAQQATPERLIDAVKRAGYSATVAG